jgi:hypothetical protein
MTIENKAPIKKVLPRKGDEYYVYDKRVNKCAKEGCEGIVKYGLNLQLQMPDGDTLNTYECNKCHMKYTAYANYVRLKDAKHLHIFNYEEIREKNKKRRLEAAKAERRARKADHKKYEKNNHKSNHKKIYNVTTIGGYHKSYEAVFGEDKRIAATD